MRLLGQEQAGRLAERHYTVSELAEQWNLSRDTIRRMFENEPGVLVFTRPRVNKRVYRTLRVPESVARRKYQKALVLRVS
jgi:transcriptional regulator GlxA family with amidase domain